MTLGPNILSGSLISLNAAQEKRWGMRSEGADQGSIAAQAQRGTSQCVKALAMRQGPRNASRQSAIWQGNPQAQLIKVLRNSETGAEQRKIKAHASRAIRELQNRATGKTENKKAR